MIIVVENKLRLINTVNGNILFYYFDIRFLQKKCASKLDVKNKRFVEFLAPTETYESSKPYENVGLITSRYTGK